MSLKQSILEVNLSALAQNMAKLKAQVAPTVKVIAVVKADGYGTQIKKYWEYLVQNGADYFAVSTVHEGIELREQGCDTPIIVFNPNATLFEEIVHHNLEPSLYSEYLSKAFTSFAKKRALKNYPVHVKVNTGMNRLGISSTEAVISVAQLLADTTETKVKSVFSHLSSSEEAEKDIYTREQFEQFTTLADTMAHHLPYPFMKHILNTGGILRFPNYSFEAIRPGIGLYGVSMLEDESLQPVCMLKSPVISTHSIKKGDAVGYNRCWIMPHDGQISVVSIGFADGLKRCLGNGNWSLRCNNQDYPIIGNVCMDVTIIDTTDGEVSVGDEVLIFGWAGSLEAMAKKANSSPHEILTSITQRVKRVYL